MLKRIKKRVLKLLYKRELHRKNKKPKSFKKIINNPPRISVIVDSNMEMKFSDFKFISEVFLIPMDQINFLWFNSDIWHDIPNHYHIGFEDISFFGNFNNTVSPFFEKEVDILINAYREESLLLKYLSLRVNNSFSVGCNLNDIELNDFLFDYNPINNQNLTPEFSKYLKIIFDKQQQHK